MEKQMKSAASLRIIGEGLVPEEITRILGRPPTRAQSKGQVLRHESTGREWTSRTGIWHFRVADRAPDDLNGQVMEILGQLNQDLAVWASLSARFRMDIFCGLFMAKNNEGLSLSPEVLLALGQRRIELGLDLYDPPEPAEDEETP
jgi:hypothetical protein